jgi:glutamyl-tRNA synthetase
MSENAEVTGSEPVSTAPPAASVRCRFAPAPSGQLHVGGARTALFNWLFSRHHGGAFILRVEDTDIGRVTEEAFLNLKSSLRWLGLDWDEGPDVGGPHAPYRQSERMAAGLYAEVGEDLRGRGLAYPCYCTPEELEERRRAAMARGEAPGYDGRCRRLTEDERGRFDQEGRPPALRFAAPEGRDVVVPDLVRGDAHFPSADLRDFVILRSDGTPTYLLAAAVDDHRMGMTHVIRGEDLLPSTPRQILLFEAFGAEPPRYAHLPLIVGPDRHPLSKRHGSVAVEAFREMGFLPEAMVNYLALLGWSSPDGEEVLSAEEMIERFDLDRVSHNPAAFDVQKLEWMNGHYIRTLEHDDLADRVSEALAGSGLTAPPAVVRQAIPLVNERMKHLTESVDLLRFLFTDDIELDEKARKLVAKIGPEYLREAASRLAAVEDWELSEIERVLTALQEDSNLSRTNAWQPIRAAATGSVVSPPLPESLALLGRDRTVRRLRLAADQAASLSQTS